METKKNVISSLVFDRPQNLKTCTRETRRTCTLVYYLRIKDELRQVCKQMFLGTFGLKEWTVRSWAKTATHGVHQTPTTQPAMRRARWPVPLLKHYLSYRLTTEATH
ncbi:hypothetical protein BaRGS_00009446 [Batillaria attramentaria]|uniref:Mos1 transposase HTH domain-containing protein n=1 Tax=Batillaria attramentaria TaxID=370345 RepID=A0ABD0LJ18_9CAEN